MVEAWLLVCTRTQPLTVPWGDLGKSAWPKGTASQGVTEGSRIFCRAVTLKMWLGFTTSLSASAGNTRPADGGGRMGHAPPCLWGRNKMLSLSVFMQQSWPLSLSVTVLPYFISDQRLRNFGYILTLYLINFSDSIQSKIQVNIKKNPINQQHALEWIDQGFRFNETTQI